MRHYPTAEEFARLQATVIAQQVRLARLERSRRRPRRRFALALVTALVALVPLAVLAAPPFTDLTGGVHDPNIGAIYDAGVTRGCVPDQEYCPTANVTREEMASFLARLGGLGTNPPVANARTAQTVPDGSITAAKMSAEGSAAGQTLVSTGTGVAWQAAERPRPGFAATAFNFSSLNVPNCSTGYVVVSLPLAVATPSRLVASGSLIYGLNVNGASQPVIYARLRDRFNMVTLGTTPKILVNVPSGPPSTYLASQGVLSAGDDSAAYGAALTVEPGEYILQLALNTTGGTCGGGRSALVFTPALTYHLAGTAP